MKKKMAKAISILLVSLMLVAMFPVAFAAEPAEVTVSVKDTVFNASVWTENGDSIVLDSATTVTRYNWITVKNSAGTSVGGHRIPSASKVEGKNVFSVNVKAEESTYEVYVTPVKSGRGCSYTVTVDGTVAGRIDTRDTNLANTEYVVADKVKLNTVYVTPDENGWVNITFENVSARAELADGYNDTIGFTDITLVPVEVLVPVETTISMRDRGLDYSKPTEYNMKVTFNSNNGTRPGNGAFNPSKDTIEWLSSSTLDNYVLTDYTVNKKIEFVAGKTTMTNFRELILKDAASGATVNYGTYNWPLGSANSDLQFTFKTKLADGAYNVSITPVISMRGCTYGVYVNGQYAGSVDTFEAHAGSWNANAYAGAPVSLNTIDVEGDMQGWVEVTIKKESVPAGNTSGVASIGFKDITFTPAMMKVHVAADTPSETDDELITCEGYEVGTVADVPFKSTLVFTANDTETNKFLYWINNSNKQVISEEATLTLSATSNVSISAVYAESGNTRYDYFTASGQRIASYFGSAPEAAPEIPATIGYTAGGEWTEDNSYETDDYVAYAPDYTNAEALTFNTTIDGVEGTVTYDEEITVTADESNFSYWTKAGKAVSFMKNYTFFAWGDEAVEKVCGVSVASNDRKPQVVLFKRGNDYMLELVACEDVEIIEKGILFASAGTPTIGSTITKAKSNSDSKQFTASSTYSVARAYLVYRDDDGVKVVYSK